MGCGTSSPERKDRIVIVPSQSLVTPLPPSRIVADSKCEESVSIVSSAAPPGHAPGHAPHREALADDDISFQNPQAFLIACSVVQSEAPNTMNDEPTKRGESRIPSHRAETVSSRDYLTNPSDCPYALDSNAVVSNPLGAPNTVAGGDGVAEESALPSLMDDGSGECSNVRSFVRPIGGNDGQGNSGSGMRLLIAANNEVSTTNSLLTNGTAPNLALFSSSLSPGFGDEMLRTNAVALPTAKLASLTSQPPEIADQRQAKHGNAPARLVTSQALSHHSFAMAAQQASDSTSTASLDGSGRNPAAKKSQGGRTPSSYGGAYPQHHSPQLASHPSALGFANFGGSQARLGHSDFGEGSMYSKSEGGTIVYDKDPSLFMSTTDYGSSLMTENAGTLKQRLELLDEMRRGSQFQTTASSSATEGNHARASASSSAVAHRLFPNNSPHGSK